MIKIDYVNSRYVNEYEKHIDLRSKISSKLLVYISTNGLHLNLMCRNVNMLNIIENIKWRNTNGMVR